MAARRSFTGADEFLPPFEYFFKVITPEAIENRKLMLPEKFSMTFKDKLSNVAVLKGPHGRVWRVGLTKQGRNPRSVWLDFGFGDFLSFYSIMARHLLIFKYDGSSGFDVVICDLTACEVVYPDAESQISPGEEEEEEDDRGDEPIEIEEEEDDSDDEPTEDDEEEINDSESDGGERLVRGRNWKGKQVETGPSSSRRKAKNRAAGTASGSRRRHPARPPTAAERLAQTASGKDVDLWRRLLASSIVTSTKFSTSFGKLSQGSKRGVMKAMDCNPRNPSVLIVMRKFHVSPGVLYMPSKFGEKYFPGELAAVALRAYEGKTRFVGEWLCYTARNEPRRDVVYIRGWPEFHLGNNLVKGDVCLFELVDEEHKVFHVHMFRG